MSSILTRRSLIRGLIAAPAVVAASSLMPVRGIIMAADGPLIECFDRSHVIDALNYLLMGCQEALKPIPWSQIRSGVAYRTDLEGEWRDFVSDATAADQQQPSG